MRFNPKPKGRWRWLLLPVALVVVAGVIGKMTNTSPPTNRAQSAPDEVPELRTRLYSQSPAEVMQAARRVASEQKTWLRSWRVGPAQGNELRVEVPVLMFTDDLTLRIDQHYSQTRVNVTSQSRVGQGDFGENRRHIAHFLRALDEALLQRGT